MTGSLTVPEGSVDELGNATITYLQYKSESPFTEKKGLPRFYLMSTADNSHLIKN